MKREGEALTSPGNPLANLTTVKLSRIRSPETSSRTCVESMLCKVHPELYIPPLTQPIRNAPDLYHFNRLGLLCWVEAEQSGIFCCGLIRVVWSDGGGGLMVWFGGRVWQWSGVEFVCGGLIWGRTTDGLVWSSYVWSGLTDRINGLICLPVCLRTLVLSVGVAMVWSEKWKEEMSRWEVKLLNLAPQGSHVKIEEKCGNTFIGVVATLKRTVTTKPNYISNYRILLRIYLAKCSIVNSSARHHGNLLF